MTNKHIELPALPEPGAVYPAMLDSLSRFTAEQMCEYALAAIAAHEQALVVGEPVAWVRRHPDGALTAEFLEDAVIEPARKQSGAWVPLGVLASPPAPLEAQADSTPLLPVARIRSWTKHGEGHGDLVDWLEGSENLPDGEYDLYLGPQSEQKPVASIYISPNGEREFDDWKHDLPIGRNELFAAPVAQPATEQAEAPRNIIWDAKHPDYPVEWSNPGRAAREGEVHYIRYDLYSDAVHATQPTASNAGEREALDVIDEFEAQHDGFYLSAEDYAEWFKKLRAALASKPPAGEQKPVAEVLHDAKFGCKAGQLFIDLPVGTKLYSEPVAPPAREALSKRCAGCDIANGHPEFCLCKPATSPAQDRILADFPALSSFHEKHALGPMRAPSCLCCGQLPESIAIKHAELPGIVICTKCRDAALSATTPAPAGSDNIEAAAKRLSKCMDYPWEHMTKQGHESMRDHARAILRAARGDEVKS